MVEPPGGVGEVGEGQAADRINHRLHQLKYRRTFELPVRYIYIYICLFHIIITDNTDKIQ